MCRAVPCRAKARLRPVGRPLWRKGKMGEGRQKDGGREREIKMGEKKDNRQMKRK